MKPDLFDYDNPERAVGGAVPLVLHQQLDPADWDTFLSFCERLHYRRGQVIVRSGESDRAIYIVESGQVGGEVHAAGRMQAVSAMGPGAVFGEVGFFDAAPRSATLWAQDDVALFVLSYAAFERLAAWHPTVARKLLMDLGRVLAARLRHAEARR